MSDDIDDEEVRTLLASAPALAVALVAEHRTQQKRIAKMVKPGDRENELTELIPGVTTQRAIDYVSATDRAKIKPRNLGIIRGYDCSASRAAKDIHDSPELSKRTSRDWQVRR